MAQECVLCPCWSTLTTIDTGHYSTYVHTTEAVDESSSLISNNNNRVGKKLWSSGDDGDLVKLNCYSSGKDEAQE